MSASTDAQNKSFDTWWLHRFLSKRSAITLSVSTLTQLLAPVLVVYMLITVTLTSHYTYEDVGPTFIIAWCSIGTFTLFANTTTHFQWSVQMLSNVATVTLVTSSSCFLLTGFIRNGDDLPSAPFIIGVMLLLWSGTPTTSMWPLSITHWWAPLIVPLLYGIFNTTVLWKGVHPLEPVIRFIMVLQSALLCCTTIMLRERQSRIHFDRGGVLLDECVFMKHILGMLVPPTLLDSKINNRDEYDTIIDTTRDVMLSAHAERFANSFDGSVMMAELVIDHAPLFSGIARIQLIDRAFTMFDDIVTKSGANKIETIGGVYLVAANITSTHIPNHVEVLCRVAIQFKSVIPKVSVFFHIDARAIHLKIGIHTGHIIGGVIGTLLPRYRIFGDTVNTAARMETSSRSNCIQLSSDAAMRLTPVPVDLTLISRGDVDVKGKGVMTTFFVTASASMNPVMEVGEFEVSVVPNISGRFHPMNLTDHESQVWRNTIVTTQPPTVVETDAMNYTHYRYKKLWFSSRVVRIVEPLTVAVICVMMVCESGKYQLRDLVTESTIIGALLCISFTAAAFTMWVGDRFPTHINWFALQAVETVPVLIHAVIISQWARILGVTASTYVWIILVVLGHATYYTNIMEPTFSAVTTLLIFTHQCACMSFAMAKWDVEAMFSFVCVLFYFITSYFINVFVHERTRRVDMLVIHRIKHLKYISHSLLLNFLPVGVLQSIQDNELSPHHILAWEFESSFVLQSDIVGFTALASKITPIELCRFLHTIFSRFDELAFKMGVTKIETVGDAYIAATGCTPDEKRKSAANAISLAYMAIEMQQFCASQLAPDGSQVVMRIGLHCGPVVGGIIGSMMRYHLFGTTMDALTQLEQASKSGGARMSQSFATALNAVHSSTAIKRVRINRNTTRLNVFQLSPHNTYESIEIDGTSEHRTSTCKTYNREALHILPAEAMQLVGMGVQETFHLDIAIQI